MNHLAHALLADGRGDDFALGSACGDFVRGAPDRTCPSWPAAQCAGLRLHRAIDAYTDAHPQIVAARALFEPPLRRYAGIFLDVWFDHLLARGWRAFAHTCGVREPLDAFSSRWRTLLDAHANSLPDSLRGFLAYMHAHDLPAAYRDENVIDTVLRGIAHRLSRPAPLADALPAISARRDTLQMRFDAFWPELVAFARTRVA